MPPGAYIQRLELWHYSMRLILRSVAPSDEAFLFEVYASTRKEELDAWGWDDTQRKAFLEMQFRAQHMSYRAQFPNADHQIILKGDRPIGRIMVTRTDNEFRLVDIALLSESRGSGIGTQLVKAIIDEASQAGKPLRLQVLRTNPAARLYERLGFTVVGDDGLYVQMEIAADSAGSA